MDSASKSWSVSLSDEDKFGAYNEEHLKMKVLAALKEAGAPVNVTCTKFTEKGILSSIYNPITMVTTFVFACEVA